MVRDGDDELFSLAATVTYSYAGTAQADSEDLAESIALRHAHGRIDLMRYEIGASYEERRDSYWAPRESEVDEKAFRHLLLAALRRMKRSEPRMRAVPWLDVDGFADVLGVLRGDVESTLSEMAAEGLVRGRAATFGATLTDGRCEITAAGIRELRRSAELHSAPAAVRDSSAQNDTGRAPRVFISYSHDSKEHKDRVSDLAGQLRNEGVDCDIDQYPGSGRSGWPDWMLERIAWADFVIVVASRGYIEKAVRRAKSGVRWETLIITQDLYQSGGHNEKYIPVVIDSSDTLYIPPWLASYTYFDLSAGDQYDEMYRVLTNQPAVSRPPLGEVRVLDSAPESDSPVNPDEGALPEWYATLGLIWTGEGGNTVFELQWSPGGGFSSSPGNADPSVVEQIPIESVSVTYGAGRILRFDTVPPLRLVDSRLNAPDGSVRKPSGTGGGLPLDAWFAEFKGPP